MIDKSPSSVAHITPSVVLTDTAAPLDLLRMRQYRLGRVREQLKANDCAGALLIDPINIRYATGARGCCPIFPFHIPGGRYVFVATEGPVVAFGGVGGTAAEERALGLGTITECRPGLPINYFLVGPRLPDSVKAWAPEL